MTWVEKLAAQPCPDCQKEHDCYEWDFMTIKPGDPEYEACICFEPCNTCGGTGALVPGLRSSTPGCSWHPSLGGDGWLLVPKGQWMGVLVRVAEPYVAYLGYEDYLSQWVASVREDFEHNRPLGYGDIPEEALAHAICQAKGIE